jgi:hypothetical protein
MMAPSGKFWMPIPRARATAAVSWAGVSPWEASAKEMPTAIPSGMLWRVTARTRRGVRRPRWRKDSGVSWGSRASMASRKAMPRTDPPAAGTHPTMPMASASSMAGIRRLHMLAAIITPAANPRKIRWTVGSGRLRKKNTVAAPRAVSRAVNPVPPAAHNSACANVLFLSRRGSRAAVIGGERTDGSPRFTLCGRGCPGAPPGKMKNFAVPPMQKRRIILE